MKRWLSFLRMTYAEMIVPVLVALGSASVLLLFLFERDSPRWLLLAPVAGFLGANFWGWTASFRRLRALEDLPLSRIASCAQGYARLEGKAAVFGLDFEEQDYSAIRTRDDFNAETQKYGWTMQPNETGNA